jgi:hypothetical protein
MTDRCFAKTQDIFHGLLDGGDMLYLKSLILNPLSESAVIPTMYHIRPLSLML